jgi:outer membrane biosynthesis protein TonB
VLAGNAIRQDKPHYPQYHCGNPYPGSGVSVMRVTINPEGSVDHIEWMRGSPNYRDAVLEAVRHWTYKPYLLNGKAVWVQTFVTIDVQMGCVP